MRSHMHFQEPLEDTIAHRTCRCYMISTYMTGTNADPYSCTPDLQAHDNAVLTGGEDRRQALPHLDFVHGTAAFDVHMAHLVTNHGVPEELLQRQFRESAAFFAQPLEEKLKLQVSEKLGTSSCLQPVVCCFGLDLGLRRAIESACAAAHAAGQLRPCMCQCLQRHCRSLKTHAAASGRTIPCR